MDNITYELTRHGKIFKCPHCYETGDDLEEFNKTLSKLNLKHSEKLKEFTKGYLGLSLDPPFTDTCPYCGTKLIDTGISFDDAITIRDFSDFNKDIFNMMIDLHQKDLIEYTAKINMMKANIEKTKMIKKEIDTTPKCPKCGSTAITTGARGANWAWGFIGASQTVNRCGNCGYTWKPKK